MILHLLSFSSQYVFSNFRMSRHNAQSDQFGLFGFVRFCFVSINLSRFRWFVEVVLFFTPGSGEDGWENQVEDGWVDQVPSEETAVRQFQTVRRVRSKASTQLSRDCAKRWRSHV